MTEPDATPTTFDKLSKGDVFFYPLDEQDYVKVDNLWARNISDSKLRLAFADDRVYHYEGVTA